MVCLNDKLHLTLRLKPAGFFSIKKMKENRPSWYLYLLWRSAVTNAAWHDIGVQQGHLMWPNSMLDVPARPEWTGIILHVNQASDLSSTWCLTAATSCLSHLTVNVIVLSSTHFHEPMEIQRLFKWRRAPNAIDGWILVLDSPHSSPAVRPRSTKRGSGHLQFNFCFNCTFHRLEQTCCICFSSRGTSSEARATP